MGQRALRVLLVANDGFSAGHVARTVAIARALSRRARTRGITAQLILATTSEAHSLLADESFAVVRLPAPVAARRAGFSDGDRRRILRSVLESLCHSFGPDLLVCDTFPSGPHGELGGVGIGRAKRALVRRAVPNERLDHETLTTGLRDYDLAIVADDPTAIDMRLAIPTFRVPSITIGEARDAMPRADARRALGLPAEGKVMLVAAGGGGDPEAVDQAHELAAAVARLVPDAIVARAVGPLGSLRGPARVEPSEVPTTRIMTIRHAPLQPTLAAFDGAFVPAGYNMSHELAKEGVPAALFSRPRPFDDQAARAARFAEASLAWKLDHFDDAAIGEALAWMKAAPRPALEPGGADHAADVLLDLVTGALAARKPVATGAAP
jgi:predicted glycosyltransferase